MLNAALRVFGSVSIVVAVAVILMDSVAMFVEVNRPAPVGTGLLLMTVGLIAFKLGRRE